jgi:hypothetical protein
MEVAADICVYTNHEFILETLEQGSGDDGDDGDKPVEPTK